jgi:hypothetical protein
MAADTKLMPNSTDLETFFTKPTAPKSSWEFLRWHFFEPLLFRRYLADCLKKDKDGSLTLYALKILLLGLIPLFLGTFGASNLLIASLDLPNSIPTLFQSAIVEQWKILPNFSQKWFFLVQYRNAYSIGAYSLIFAVYCFFAGNYSLLRLGVFWNLVLYLGLVRGLFEGQTAGILHGWLLGTLIARFYAAPPVSPYSLRSRLLQMGANLGQGLGLGLVIYMLFGFVIGLREGDLWGAVLFGAFTGFWAGLAIGVSYDMASNNLFSHLWEHLKRLFSKNPISFFNNPYLEDGTVKLPHFAEVQLLKLVPQHPLVAIHFAKFLLNYRPYQVEWAYEILHAAFGIVWRNASELTSDLFQNIELLKPVHESYQKDVPSPKWVELLETLRTTLSDSETEKNLSRQILKVKEGQLLIESLWNLHPQEPFKNSSQYQGVFANWNTLLNTKLTLLLQQYSQSSKS